jgi:hypothetical protein
VHLAARRQPGRQVKELETEAGVRRHHVGKDSDELEPGRLRPVAVGGEGQLAAEALAQQVAQRRDRPGAFGSIAAGQQDRRGARHGLAYRGEQLGEQPGQAVRVEEGLCPGRVDAPRPWWPGQLGEVSAAARLAAPHVGLPQLGWQDRAEVGLWRGGDQGVREVVARAARVVGAREHHLRGDGRAGRRAGRVREHDRVGVRVAQARAGQQPGRRLVHGQLLNLPQHRRFRAGCGRAELKSAVAGRAVLAGRVVQLPERHLSAPPPG